MSDYNSLIIIIVGVVAALLMLVYISSQGVFEAIGLVNTLSYSMAFLMPAVIAFFLERTQPKACSGIIEHGLHEPPWLFPLVSIWCIFTILWSSAVFGMLFVDSLWRFSQRYLFALTSSFLLFQRWDWLSSSSSEFLSWI